MSIEVKNLDLIQNKLTKLSNALDKNQMQNTNTAIGHIIKNDIEDAFADESSLFGKKWQPLSSNTVMSYFTAGNKNRKNKRRVYGKNGKQSKAFLKKYGSRGSKKILRKSGSLADRWQVSANANEVMVYNNMANNGSFAYGLAHQFGAKTKHGTIPARPFLPIDKHGILAPKTDKAINDFLDKKIEEALK